MRRSRATEARLSRYSATDCSATPAIGSARDREPRALNAARLGPSFTRRVWTRPWRKPRGHNRVYVLTTGEGERSVEQLRCPAKTEVVSALLRHRSLQGSRPRIQRAVSAFAMSAGITKIVRMTRYPAAHRSPLTSMRGRYFPRPAIPKQRLRRNRQTPSRSPKQCRAGAAAASNNARTCSPPRRASRTARTFQFGPKPQCLPSGVRAITPKIQSSGSLSQRWP